MAVISRRGKPSKKWAMSPLNLLLCFMLLMGLFYVQVSIWLLKGTFSSSTSSSSSLSSSSSTDDKGSAKLLPGASNERALVPAKTETKTTKTTKTKLHHEYKDWREYAVELAGKFPNDIVRILKTEDPFGVRTFEKRLLEAESSKQRFLKPEELTELFPCPGGGGGGGGERITLPDQRNTDKARAFRNSTEPYFLFFQHLRKAGGTNFCTLAKKNMKREELPKYFCMPDYHWIMEKGKRGAGYLTRYTNDEITEHMRQDGHKIAGNEWDPFDYNRFFDLPATFATSFRRPLDRALSQFRFECIEDRGCKIKNVTKWWDKRKDLTNVYTWTFSSEGVRKISVGRTEHDADRRRQLVGTALDTVARFNLVMVMEWLAYAPGHVRDVLGFSDTKTLTERVRPHIGQAKRNDGQEQNSLGAAGIAKASWTPEDYLPPDTYVTMSHDLALDEILTDAARRMFLERIVCGDVRQYD